MYLEIVSTAKTNKYTFIFEAEQKSQEQRCKKLIKTKVSDIPKSGPINPEMRCKNRKLTLKDYKWSDMKGNNPRCKATKVQLNRKREVQWNLWRSKRQLFDMFSENRIWDGALDRWKAGKFELFSTFWLVDLYIWPPTTCHLELAISNETKSTKCYKWASLSLQTKWAALIVVVPKRDGTLRFSIDFQEVKPGIVRNSYPFKIMAKFCDYLAMFKHFRL